MKALGAHIRIDDGRYLAGFALVECDGSGMRLLRQLSLPAPRDLDEAGQLLDLYARTRERISEGAPNVFALKLAETFRMNPQTILALRCEGAVLGAAGHTRDLKVELWPRQRLATPAGLTKSPKIDEILARLCSRLDQEPSESEVRQAAGAAVAALIAA